MYRKIRFELGTAKSEKSNYCVLLKQSDSIIWCYLDNNSVCSNYWSFNYSSPWRRKVKFIVFKIYDNSICHVDRVSQIKPHFVFTPMKKKMGWILMAWKVSGVLGFKGASFFTNTFRYGRTILVKWLGRWWINLNTDLWE